MPAVPLPDYPQQLHDAIQSTRDGILAQRTSAQANSATALGAFDVSRRTFADARIALSDAQAALAVAAYLDRKLVDTGLTAANGVVLATTSNAKANATTAAVSLATASIRAAADAVDVVTRDVNGVAGITKSNDDDEPVDTAAKKAVDAVTKVARAVEELKSLALQANIQAAAPSTAAALLAAQTSQTSVAGILGSADTALAASTSNFSSAQSARAADLQDLFQKSAQFFISAGDDGALNQAVTTVDNVSNASLKVVIQNTEKKDAAQEPGVFATCELTPEVSDATQHVLFFVVPQAEVATFDFERAHKGPGRHHVPCPLPDASRPSKKDQVVVWSAALNKDVNNHVLRFGQDYSVFFLRMPKHGQPRATDFSFASPSITATVVLKFAGKPAIVPLPNGAFVTCFNGTDHAAEVASYDLFFAPGEVYEKGTGAELLIADQLVAANYTSFDAKTNACQHPATVSGAIRKQFIKEMSLHGPVAKDALDAQLKALDKWVHDHGKNAFYVAYYSPFTNKDGWQTAGGYKVARYTDMYGDLFDLERRGYLALALAVGRLDKKLLPQAADVLSPPSDLFPAANKPVPLPTDEAVSPAKPTKK